MNIGLRPIKLNMLNITRVCLHIETKVLMYLAYYNIIASYERSTIANVE